MLPLVLLTADFEDPDALSAWEIDVGATVGRGETSEVEIEDGAVVFRVQPTDERFVSVQRTVDVEPGTWIEVRARVRTEGVDPDAARFDACYVFVSTDSWIRGFDTVSGDTPWTAREALFQVPTGARQVRVGMFLSMPGVAAFDDLVVTAVPSPFHAEARGPYVYHLLEGDAVSDRHHAYNVAAYERTRDWFGAADLPPVAYHKYPDRETKRRLSGYGGNAHVQDGAIHSLWPMDGHEIVHLFAAAWGHPPPLLAEGLAVHLSGSWQGRPVRDYAADVLAGGRWIPVAALLDPSAFRSDGTTREAYAIAGAFVGWVVETRGKRTLRRLYKRLDGSEKDQRHLRRALGMGLDEADAALRAWLDPEGGGAIPETVGVSINDAFDGERGVVVAPAEDEAVLGYGREIAGHFFGGRLVTDAESLDLPAATPFVVYGTPERNDLLARWEDALPFRVEPDAVTIAGRRFTDETGVRLFAAVPNPSGEGPPWLVYTATSDALVPGMNDVFHGPTGWLVVDAEGTVCGSGFLPAEPPAEVREDGCP